MKILSAKTHRLPLLDDDGDPSLLTADLPRIAVVTSNTVYGTSGADNLAGTVLDDKILAGLGSDTITGSAGTDTIVAGYAGSAAPWRYGFYDNDTVNYVNTWQSYGYFGDADLYLVADLQAGTVQKVEAGSDFVRHTDTLTGVDNLWATNGDDTLLGRNYWDFETFRGYFGFNFIDGRGGNDSVDYSWASIGLGDRVEVSLAAGTASLFSNGSGATDTLRQIESVTGTQGTDVFNAVGYGGSSVNRNSFGEDYNIYNPLGGNDEIFGNGNTIVSLAGVAGRLTVDLGLLADGTTALRGIVGFTAVAGATGYAAGDYLMSGISQIRAGAYDDTLIGGGRTNSNGSSSTVSGDNSFEGFRGNGGDDFIDGKTGFDRADYAVGNQSQGISVNLAAGTVSGDPLLTGDDTLRGIEGIAGTYGDDYYSAVGFTLSNAGTPSVNIGDVIVTAPVGETLASNAYNEFRVLAGNDRIDGNGATRISFQGLLIEPTPTDEWSVDITFTSASAGSGIYGGQTLSIPGGSLGRVDFTGTYAIRGSAAADRVVGAASFQHLAGYYGDDELFGGDGADILFGHLGGDGAAENLSSTFSDDDKLYGGAGNDLLRGDFGTDILDGGAGDDRMEGGTGWDAYYVDAAGDVVVELAGDAGGYDTVNTSISLSLSDNVEALFLTGLAAINGTGNALDNFIVGNAAANVLDGGAGADTMVGGLGNDTYYVDAYAFQDDNNTDKAIETSTLATEIDTVISSASEHYLGANLENLTLIGAAEQGWGNELNNVITGTALYNYLDGGAGDDTLDGGTGADELDGREGNDTYYVDNSNDIIYERVGGGTDLVVASASYVLTNSYLEYNNAENLTLTGALAINGTGNALDNVITGNAAANVLSGGDGADTLNGQGGIDTMIGGLGNDTYVVDATADVASETSALVTEIDTVLSSASFTLGNYVERLTLTGALAINGTGNTLANLILGNSAANVLNGGAGIDTLAGGLGNDSYYVDVAGDIVSESSTLATEIDTVYAGATWTLGANLERLTLTGALAINGTGNTLANLILGNAAANVLNGGAGIDTMAGGLGNDSYYVDVAGDIVSESSTLATEIDTVYAGVTWTLGANLERLTLTGALAINGTGNTLANLITGNAAANVLNGGAGIDTMAGGLGNDSYYVDVAGEVVTETSALATEIDTVFSGVTWTLGANLENLTLTGALAVNGTGNTLVNTITGNGAANTLDGGVGNDVLSGGLGNDVLIGGLGNDRLSGGGGLDFFRFTAAPNATTNLDTITDFLSADDRIDLDDAAFAGIGALGQMAAGAFVLGAAAADASDRIIYNQATGKMYFDADGSGAAAAVQFAAFNAGTVITLADLWVV